MAFDMKEFSEKYKLHAETVSFLKAKSDSETPPPEGLSVEEVRQGALKDAELYAGPVEFEGIEREFLVPSIYNKDGVPITAYRAKSCDMVVSPPVVVYFHGGGNTVGCRKTHESVCKILSREAPCVVVNVEYRLAPEHPFPADHDDAKCAVRWVAMNKSLVGGVNNSVVGVCGDSAGARIAATVSHELSSSLGFSVLVYPQVSFEKEYKSVEEFSHGPCITKARLDWYRDNYITEKDFGKPRASPLCFKDFSNLPPTLFIVAELDPLRDGCYEYYEKLKKAGVKGQILTMKGVPHGFWKYPGHFVENCRRAHEKAAKFIKAHS